MLKHCVAILCAGLFVCGANSADKKETDNFDGTWVPIKAELAGTEFPEEIRKQIKLEIKGDNYTVTIGKMTDKGTSKINAKAKPKEVDITSTEGANKGKTFLAIYELDGDMLKVCYDLSGKERPKEFKTMPNTQLYLVTYKREKP
jgi:uncharacterized protein (TIGR03067 family)